MLWVWTDSGTGGNENESRKPVQIKTCFHLPVRYVETTTENLWYVTTDSMLPNVVILKEPSPQPPLQTPKPQFPTIQQDVLRHSPFNYDKPHTGLNWAYWLIWFSNLQTYLNWLWLKLKQKQNTASSWWRVTQIFAGDPVPAKCEYFCCSAAKHIRVVHKRGHVEIFLNTGVQTSANAGVYLTCVLVLTCCRLRFLYQCRCF